MDELDDTEITTFDDTEPGEIVRLLETQPTTMRGIIALLVYLGQRRREKYPADTILADAFEWEDEDIEDARNEFPLVLAHALRSLTLDLDRDFVLIGEARS